MNILFRTSGGRAKGKQLGFGHVFRCINLARQFKNQNVFFLIEDYGGVKSLLKTKNFQNIDTLKKNSNLKNDIKKTLNLIEQHNIDLVVVDKFRFKQKYVSALMEKIKVCVITDLFKYQFKANLIVNGFVGFENKIIYNKFDSKCLLGPKYQILALNFSKKSKNKKTTFILSSFGGFDEKNINQIFLKAINDFPQLEQCKCILGPSSNIMPLNSHRNIEILDYVHDMHSEMSKSKFGLCSGGITSYEFASLRIPFGIVCQNKHQLITAKQWQKKHLGINLGLVNSRTKNKINHFILMALNNHLVLSKKHIVDGKGTIRIAKELKELISNKNN